MAVADGYTGKLIVEPDEATLAFYQEKQRSEMQQKALLQELKNKENITKSGHLPDEGILGYGSGREDKAKSWKNATSQLFFHEDSNYFHYTQRNDMKENIVERKMCFLHGEEK